MSVFKMIRLNMLRTLCNQNCTPLRYYSSSHIVQMRGLDYDTTEQDVIDFFKPLGIVPLKVHLKSDGSGRTAGFSEVEFSTHSEAVVALRKKNAFIGNRFIRLTLKSTDTENETAKCFENQSMQSSSEAAVKTDYTKKPLESPHPAGHFVRMKNVPWRITDQDIFDFFCPVGAHPVSVRPLYNESGFRTGEFDVQFLSLEDVEKAGAKNNAYLRNKYVQLFFKSS